MPTSMEELPRPVVLVKWDEEENEPCFHKQTVADILNQITEMGIAEHKAVVVSIIGFCVGKTFLLNFLLKYMTFLETSSKKIQMGSWLGDENTPLEGFPWGTQASKEKNPCILMWPKIFRVALRSKEKVAVIFLQTIGATFDNKTSTRQCEAMFALSTALSSILLYNSSQNISEHDLSDFEIFSKLAYQIISPTAEKKKFHKVQFVVRDWPESSKVGCWLNGGRSVIEKKFETSNEQTEAQQSVRNHVKSCFSDIKCWLFPHPGSKAMDLEFDGKLSDIRPKFKESLEQFCPQLLDPENLVVKEINDQKVTLQQLFVFLPSFVENVKIAHFTPEPKSSFEAIEVDKILHEAFTIGKETYQLAMEVNLSKTSEHCQLTPDQLEREHLVHKRKAKEEYCKKCPTKIHEDMSFQKNKNRLEQDLEDIYNLLKPVCKSRPNGPSANENEMPYISEANDSCSSLSSMITAPHYNIKSVQVSFNNDIKTRRIAGPLSLSEFFSKKEYSIKNQYSLFGPNGDANGILHLNASQSVLPDGDSSLPNVKIIENSYRSK